MPLPDDLRQSNPERYVRLSEPFESKEQMEEAFAGFFRELGELREKYKIPDVLCVASANFDRDGVSDKGVADMQYGDSRLRPALVLYLYRQESEMIQRLMKGLSNE